MISSDEDVSKSVKFTGPDASSSGPFYLLQCLSDRTKLYQDCKLDNGFFLLNLLTIVCGMEVVFIIKAMLERLILKKVVFWGIILKTNGAV